MRDAFGAHTIDGRPEIASESSTARGAAKRSGKRRGKHVEVSAKYLSDNENVVGTDAVVLW